MSTFSNKIVLMDRPRIRRTIKRISFQIAEKAKQKKISLVGLNERGFAIASEIFSILDEAFDNEVELILLDVDNSEQQAETIKKEYKFKDSVVLLVDDVMFTGRTMFKALSLLLKDPEFTVYIAVLIDRGHLALPVKSEFIGLEIPTKPKEHIEISLHEGYANEVLLYKE
jgi:pyrimidine operon attenuation protein / uracil phosphoribosyltransferase